MSNDQFVTLSGTIANSLATTLSDYAERIMPSTKRKLPPVVEPIRLSPFDLLMPPINMRMPMLFKVLPASGLKSSSAFRETFETMIAKLKASLAEALELYPPVAGTIHTSPEDPSVATIVCDGRGATFMTQIESRSYVESEHTLDGLSGTDLFGLDASRTVFGVKLTLFSCGTVAMITSMHHYVSDLTSYMDFLSSWNQLSRGDLENLVYPESWSRDLNLATPVIIPPTMPGIMVLPPSLDSLPMPTLRMFDGLRWFISDASLIQLKTGCMDLLNDENSVTRWISSSDAFTGLVWGAMTRARQNTFSKAALLMNDHVALESLGVAVDGRERLGFGSSNPGSPTHYFGNLNLSLAVYAPRADLLEATLDATSRIALAIRKKIQSETTPETITARAAFLKAQTEATRPHSTRRIMLEGDCRSTNWSKYDLTSFDFGFGSNVKSEETRIGTKTIFPASMFLITKSSGGLLVATTVEEEADALLRVDPLLTRYAEILSD